MAKDRSGTTPRLQKLLSGAFAGSPTPLKDIPTRAGESRAVKVVAKSSPQPKVEKKKAVKREKKT